MCYQCACSISNSYHHLKLSRKYAKAYTDQTIVSPDELETGRAPQETDSELCKIKTEEAQDKIDQEEAATHSSNQSDVIVFCQRIVQ